MNDLGVVVQPESSDLELMIKDHPLHYFLRESLSFRVVHKKITQVMAHQTQSRAECSSSIRPLLLEQAASVAVVICIVVAIKKEVV